MSQMDRVVIIGAGLAGLAAARRLKAAGYDVLVLDKGRRIGGRISTRRADGYLFNHGAQFVTARSTEFSEICLSAEQTGKMALWDIGRKAPCFSGTPDMRSLAEMLGDGLNIIQQCEISDIAVIDAQFQLIDTKAQHYQARHLLVTSPAPQTARLVRPLSDEAASIAEQARYHPCWTVMAGFATPCDGLDQIASLSGGHIASATAERARPGASGLTQSLTLQANEAFSAEWLEAPDTDRIIRMLMAEFGRISELTLPEADYLSAHRWRYAKVEQPVDAQSKRLFDVGAASGYLGIAGDWHPVSADIRPATGQRAEEAFLSGHSLAEALISTR